MRSELISSKVGAEESGGTLTGLVRFTVVSVGGASELSVPWDHVLT